MYKNTGENLILIIFLFIYHEGDEICAKIIVNQMPKKVLVFPGDSWKLG